MKRIVLLLTAVSCHSTAPLSAADPKAPDYSKDVFPIFKKYCIGCHDAEEANGELSMQRFPQLMKGGENGAVIVPGKADKSRLILLVEQKAEPFMPPEDNKAPSKKEIALLRAWIAAGAKGPVGKDSGLAMLTTPKIATVGQVRKPINALVYSPDGKWIAVARYGTVEILTGKKRKPQKTLTGHSGHINDVGFSADSKTLFVAAGEPGLFGEVTLWNTADWKRLRTIDGHRDSVYAADISPDGKLLATGSYDQAIKIWNTSNGTEVKTLKGHNGAVFDLAFGPKGRLLASASGDFTVKLWDVAAGKRLDTFGQPTKEQYTVAFSPDGRFVAAAGVDNRIRVWRISKTAREGTNRQLYSRFAHEAPIIKLVFSPNGKTLVSSAEDRTIKTWETETFTQRSVLERQSDWATALAIDPAGKTLLVGRLDGSLATYDLRKQGGSETASAQPVTTVQQAKPSTAPTTDKLPEVAEVEPNDGHAQATTINVPGAATGVLLSGKGSAPDADLFGFDSKAGETWIIETNAARMKSPADTKIEVLDSAGKPVLRYLLRAVRDSYVTFRPIDSTQNQVRVKFWEEMKLNQYLYMNGEVCKLFRAPRGPDSGFMFYTINGKRECYFDTSATVHAKDDAVYIVDAYSPGSKLADNGLPVFPLFYANDDDGRRKLGNDSRLTFTAPADGRYLVRVTDVRGFGGKDHKYRLTVRRPKPDFRVTLAGKGATVAAESGQRLTVNLERIDNFNGEVRVDVTGMPAGFSVTSPIVIEAGHLQARGVINVAAGAKTPGKEAWSKVKVTASGQVHGSAVSKELGNLGEIKLAKKPNYVVRLEIDPSAAASARTPSGHLVISPGTTITAMVRIERNGYKGELKFDVDNLPHGVIVDNIGLSGVLIRTGETERQIFLTASDWVDETTRRIHAVAIGQGTQASPPMTLHVRRPPAVAQAK